MSSARARFMFLFRCSRDREEAVCTLCGVSILPAASGIRQQHQQGNDPFQPRASVRARKTEEKEPARSICVCRKRCGFVFLKSSMAKMCGARQRAHSTSVCLIHKCVVVVEIVFEGAPYVV